MSYSDFTLPDLQRKFQLVLDESKNLFADVAEADLPRLLADLLARYFPLAVNLNTEKARSEFLIAPLLAEFKLLHRDRISLFSGFEFNVDEEAGLKGRCDFILARSPEQLFLNAPICMLVEAKKEDIVGGIPQCLAEMVAAQKFNARQGQPIDTVFGVVTTGELWRFLMLEKTKASVDMMVYSIHSTTKLFGILTAIALGDNAETRHVA